MLKRSMALNVTPGVWRNVVSSAGGTPFAEVKNDEGATVAVFGNIHFPHCRDNAQFFASARRDLVPDAIRVIEELLAEREAIALTLREAQAMVSDLQSQVARLASQGRSAADELQAYYIAYGPAPEGSDDGEE